MPSADAPATGQSDRHTVNRKEILPYSIASSARPAYSIVFAADRSADDSADWASDAVAFIKAMSGAAGNALSLCGERHSERCETRDTN